jgi:cytosine/adenosine deaminase-related metal-dependent hydrolase
MTSRPTDPTVVRAAWIVPWASGGPGDRHGPDGGPVASADLRIEVGKVAAIEPARGRLEAGGVDLGEVVLLPGTVNAHTHLELSGLAGKVRYRGNFVTWLTEVTARRPTDQSAIAAVVREGADASLAAGVTCVGDICYGNRAWRTLRDHPIRAVCFAECLGIGRRRHDALSRLGRDMAGMAEDDGLRIGISPHAPYSVAEEAYRGCLDLARSNNWPLTTHLAETPDEGSFVRHGAGNLHRFLTMLGIADDSVSATGLSPVAYAARVGLLAHPTLLAHVNYLDDEDLAMLAASQASVAYCPRSHRYFRHKGHRFTEMLAAGVNVCVGTDSLASSPTLSVLDELRFLRRRHPELPGATLLAMGTINGARALGWDDRIGSLSPGKWADAVAVPLDADGPDDPIENVLRSDLAPTATIVGGHMAFRAGV